MYSETLSWRCHRTLIAVSLVARDLTVHHHMSEGKVIEHQLGLWRPEPFVTAGRVTYQDPQH